MSRSVIYSYSVTLLAHLTWIPAVRRNVVPAPPHAPLPPDRRMRGYNRLGLCPTTCCEPQVVVDLFELASYLWVFVVVDLLGGPSPYAVGPVLSVRSVCVWRAARWQWRLGQTLSVTERRELSDSLSLCLSLYFESDRTPSEVCEWLDQAITHSDGMRTFKKLGRASGTVALTRARDARTRRSCRAPVSLRAHFCTAHAATRGP